MITAIGIVSGFAMPLLNIPLIVRVIRRRSSGDISLVWTIGVWLCVMGMLPSSLRSPDIVLRTFGIMNAIFFTGTFASVLYFHPSVKK